MTQCPLCDKYLNGALSEEEETAYRAHLTSCAACRKRIAEWRSFEGRLKKWGASMPRREATVEEFHALMRLASIRREHGSRDRPRFSRIAVGLSLSATAAAVAVFFWMQPVAEPPRGIAVGIAQPHGEKLIQRIRPGDDIEAPEDSSLVADIAKDTVGLSPKTKLKIVRARNNRTRLLLKQGTAACRVSKRNAGEEFIVEAHPLTIKVVGTAFSVSRDASGKAQVAVLEGTVRVTDSQHRVYMLGAKEGILATADGKTEHVRHATEDSLEMTAALLSLDTADSEPTAPKLESESSVSVESETETENSKTTQPVAEPQAGDAAERAVRRKNPPLRTWRNWILQGQADRTSEAARRYLKASPNDPDVWAVLADCEKKQNNFKAAARAYEKVIAHGASAQRARASYRLASMLQSKLADHERAVELFLSYKKSAHAAPELLHLADVKIVRSLVALRRCKEAKDAAEHLRKQDISLLSSHLDKALAPCKLKD